MKKYFVTGLVILLPLAVTLAIVVFLFNLLTEPFAGAISAILEHYDLVEKDFLFFSGRQIQFFISQVFILIFLFFFTVLLGMIARYFFIHYFIRFWDYIFHKIPLVRSIYKASQDVINTIFTQKTNSFKQVVMVPFPHTEVYAVGLVTQDNINDISGKSRGEMVAVFIPTAPNPTSGFLVLYPRKELIYLDMKAEDAFKYIVSCGVILTPFSITTYEEAKKKETENKMPETS